MAGMLCWTSSVPTLSEGVHRRPSPSHCRGGLPGSGARGWRNTATRRASKPYNGVMEGLSVAVVGGGPAGVVAAGHFAKLGARVDVYERRTPAEQAVPQLGWPIAVGRVAIEAIEAADLSADFGPTNRAEGIGFQEGLKPPKHIGRWNTRMPAVVDLEHFTTRAGIVEHLREQLKNKYGDSVVYWDGCRVVGGNLCEGEVTIQCASGLPCGGEEHVHCSDSEDKTTTVHVNLVVVADGAGSRSRRLIQNHDPSMEVSRTFSECSVLAFRLPPCNPAHISDLPTPSGYPLEVFPSGHSCDVEGVWLFFMGPERNPPGEWFWMVVRGADGGQGMRMTLTARTSWFLAKKTVEETRQLLDEAFPQVPEVWLEECAKVAAVATRDTGLRTSSFVTCSQLGSGRAVLIGDAAHAVSANVGSGAAHAMQDAMLLANVAQSLLYGAASQTDTSEGTSMSVEERREVLVGLGAAWSAERGADAKALALISQSINDQMLWRCHRSVWRILKALPVLVIEGLSSSTRAWLKGIKAVIGVPELRNVLVNGGGRPSQVKAACDAAFVRGLAYVGVAVAVVVCFVIIVWPRVLA